MTTKEIADSVGKTERCVRNWIGKVAETNSVIAEKISGSSPMKPADYTVEETLSIIEAGMGKNAAGIYRANVRAPASTALNDREISLITQIVAATVAETIKQLDGRMAKIENRIEARQALLPPPALKPRDHINMIVREYAGKHNIPHGKAWSELYRQFGYRTNSNPSQCAKNREMPILEYIEAEGMIETLESVAIEVMQ